jgi:hypothetical protein
MPVHGPARGAYEGRAGAGGGGSGGGGGWAVRLETDSASGVAAERAAARSLRGLADTFASQLSAVAIGGGDGAGAGILDAATASVRLTFPTNRRWAVDRARRAGTGKGGDGAGTGAGAGGGFSGGGSDEDAENNKASFSVR